MRCTARSVSPAVGPDFGAEHSDFPATVTGNDRSVWFPTVHSDPGLKVSDTLATALANDRSSEPDIATSPTKVRYALQSVAGCLMTGRSWPIPPVQ